MNRRGILALLGGAIAAPSVVGAKTASAVLDVNPHSPSPMPLEQIGIGNAPTTNTFWGSPAQIAIDASREARHEIAQNTRYAHMKSWGPAFRHTVISRERQIERLLEEKLRTDEAFLSKFWEALK
jgi:hypothetical protein